MLDPCWLAIEVAEDRQHVAICAAGRLDDGYLAVEQAAYPSGVSGVVEEVLRLRSERGGCTRWWWTRAVVPAT
jgi:hypothetical protein